MNFSLLSAVFAADPPDTKVEICAKNPPQFGTLARLLCDFNGADKAKGLGQVNSFLWNIITLALGWAGWLALVMILYGAFIYATSYGDDSKAEQGKKTLLWAIIGLIILVVARSIIIYIQGELT